METLGRILEDWQSCKPSGVILQAEHLHRIIERLSERANEAGIPRAACRRVYELLRPSERDGALPLFVQYLHIDGGYCLGKSHAAVVHFLYFWQAFDEVWRRLGPANKDERANEPIASEAAGLRDALLAHFEGGSLTSASFMAALLAARKMSTDQPAWTAFEAAATHTVGKELNAENAEAVGLRRQMGLDLVSTLMIGWLQDLSEDYCRGERGRSIQSMQHVLQCSKQEACINLGASGWDIEAALRRFYVGGPPLASMEACRLGSGWSSQSAKLRTAEVQCQICVTDFCPGTEPIVTRCCFQVICVHCATTLTSAEGMLPCPFCRKVESNPMCDREESKTEEMISALMDEDLLSGAFATAARCAEVAGQLTKDVMAAFTAEERRPHDLRLDVVLRPLTSVTSRGGA